MRFFATRERDERCVAFIRDLGYRRAIEIGVREGEFARLLLEETNLEELVGIDRNVLGGPRDLMSRYPGRYRILEASSPECAAEFADGYFDFVYVDADHGYEAVAQDLEAWWPKVAQGGIFCGDDYADTDNPGEGKYGVVRAVNEFVDRHGLVLHVLGAADDRASQLAFAAENGRNASAYLRKEPHLPFQNPLWFVYK